MADLDYDAIVIGAGPAGLATAIYIARGGKKVAVIEQSVVGGQIATTELLENYPGFPEGISGKELMEKFEAQARKFGADIQFGRVDGLELDGAVKQVMLGGFPLKCKAVVVATGIIQKLGVPGEEEYLGRGVSYCATCDGALYRGRPVAVIGATDWAVEEAAHIAKFASKLYFVPRSSHFKAESEERKNLVENPVVTLVTSASPTEILGDAQGVTGLKLSSAEGNDFELKVDGVFIAAGKKLPGTKFLQGVVSLDPTGYVVTDANRRTSVPGVFAVGDVSREKFHQVALAVGDGAVAGMEVLSFLRAG